MTLVLAAAAWVVAVEQMKGMDMSVIAVFVLAQKLLPERLSVDGPVALVIVSLGITVAVGP